MANTITESKSFVTVRGNEYLHATWTIKNGKLISSEVSKCALGINEKELENKKQNEAISTLEEFNERLEDVLNVIGFSSKRVGFDQFDRKYYDEDNIYHYSIKGSRNQYMFPRGVVYLNKKNEFFFDVANIVYMINQNAIPAQYFNFPEINYTNFNIPRSSGIIQYGWFVPNSSFKISRTRCGIYLYVEFINKEDGLGYQKSISFEDFVKLNEITNFTIKIPKLNKSKYNFSNYTYLEDSLINQIIINYNSKIIEFVNMFISKYFSAYDVIKDHEKFKYIFAKK
jgi:hypothetical protein